MYQLLPQVKHIEETGGTVEKRRVKPYVGALDARLSRALAKLPQSDDGLAVTFEIGSGTGEEYTLTLNGGGVLITAPAPAGAFYALQTLRQILAWEKIPCLSISDKPDFAFRGFYHDVTRGKVPKLETLMALVDTLASYKVNSLQLYVEHTFAFRECRSLNEKTGFLTGADLRALDEYCRANFIDFIPSLATFGHMYEILELPEYKHLSVLSKDYQPSPNRWHERMRHHTINPLAEGSFPLVAGLIDQYAPNFTSEYFNICGDETFDLKTYAQTVGADEGRLYTDFIGRIINHVKEKGKRVMMWGDVLLSHPDMIGKLPADTVFLNWDYDKEPKEENVALFAEKGRPQIVCPGTWTWNQLSERIAISESNICKMAEYGYRHGALGILNTNWGDWGNSCSIELSLYGLALGAEKAWSATTPIDEDYDRRASEIVYGDAAGASLIKALDALDVGVFISTINAACSLAAGKAPTPITITPETLARVQADYAALRARIEDSCIYPAIKEEMLVAAEGICVLTELVAALQNEGVTRLTDTRAFLDRYSALWLKKNQRSELALLTAAITRLENA